MLARVVVHAPEPPRELIEDRNIGILQQYAGHLPANDLRAMYQQTISLIESAMRADLLGEAWPLSILDPPEDPAGAIRSRVEGKRLTHTTLAPLLNGLGQTDRALLAPIVDLDRLRATDLERKLIAAGANPSLVDEAKQVRAQASHRLEEFRASIVRDPEATLADLEYRLLTLARSTAATSGDIVTAPKLWSELGQILHAYPIHYDPRQVLHREPLLLLGAICHYSDECKFGWR